MHVYLFFWSLQSIALTTFSRSRVQRQAPAESQFSCLPIPSVEADIYWRAERSVN